MKKAFLPLLCLSLSITLCGFTDIPEVEETPNTAEQYALEEPPHDGLSPDDLDKYLLDEYSKAAANNKRFAAQLSDVTFETKGRIPGPTAPVPEFSVDIPVLVVDQNGNPVQNAGVVMAQQILWHESAGSFVMRERPQLDAAYDPTLTNYEGKATLSYKGRFTETSLFVITPETLASRWNTYIRENDYPPCTRIDLTLPTTGEMEQQVITVQTSSPAQSDYVFSVQLSRGGKPAVDYICTLSKKEKNPWWDDGSDVHPDIGYIPGLSPQLLTDAKGKASFQTLSSGEWTLSVFDPENRYKKDGSINILKRYTFTLDKKNPSRSIIILLP